MAILEHLSTAPKRKALEGTNDEEKVRYEVFIDNTEIKPGVLYDLTASLKDMVYEMAQAYIKEERPLEYTLFQELYGKRRLPKEAFGLYYDLEKSGLKWHRDNSCFCTVVICLTNSHLPGDGLDMEINGITHTVNLQKRNSIVFARIRHALRELDRRTSHRSILTFVF